MKITFLFLVSIMLFFDSCEKLERHDNITGSIKDIITGTPIRNTEFKVVHKTSKYSDEYFSSTDDNGNYSVKATFRKDYSFDEFTIQNCFYNSRVGGNTEKFYDFYIHVGQLYSQNNLIVSFKNTTTSNDILVLKLLKGGKYYNREVQKIYVGPFPSKLNISVIDTIENLSSNTKSDGIFERNLSWKFGSQSGGIILKDNYLTGTGTIDSLSF